MEVSEPNGETATLGGMDHLDRPVWEPVDEIGETEGERDRLPFEPTTNHRRNEDPPEDPTTISFQAPTMADSHTP